MTDRKTPTIADIQALTFGIDESETCEQIAQVINQLSAEDEVEIFTGQLDAVISEKEKDIEKVCNSHYREFISGIEHLFVIRQNAADLANKLVKMNLALQESGHLFLSQKKKLGEANTMVRNMKAAENTLEKALVVLKQSYRVKQYIDEGEYYPALNTLDQLQYHTLPQASQFGFNTFIKTCIPVLKELIRERVMVDMKDWHYKIRDELSEIGRQVLENIKRRIHSTHASGKCISKKLVQTETLHQSASVSIPVIDFKPLYKSYNIFQKLNDHNYFKVNFNYDVKTIITIILNKGQIKETISNIVGFFLVDYLTYVTLPNLKMFFGNLNYLWFNFVDKFVILIAESVHKCEPFEDVVDDVFMCAVVFDELNFDARKIFQLHNALKSLVTE